MILQKYYFRNSEARKNWDSVHTFAVVVTNAVGVLLVKLLRINWAADELSPEVPDGVFHGESDSLEEESVLEPGLVLEVVRVGEGALHALHAKGEGALLGGQRLDHLWGDDVAALVVELVHGSRVTPVQVQVLSLTQLYSVDFTKSRIGIKKVRFQQTHNQGLCQLLLTVSWDLRA